MVAPQQQIDSYLGPESYADWKDMEGQARGEQNRYDNIRRLLNLPWISPLYDRSETDLNILNSIAGDYGRGMNLVASGRKVSKAKIEQVQELYTDALIVVDGETDILEALWASGFAAVWVLFPFVLLQARSQEMLDALPALREELARAEREVLKTQAKTTIHLFLTFFELLNPELALTRRAAIYLGEVAVNKVLGPDDPTTFQKYEGITTHGVEQFSHAVHHIEEYGEKARSVANWTGKAATAAKFYFDVDELLEGYERLDKLKELIEKVKHAYDRLIKVIEDNKPKLQQFLFAFDRWMRSIEDARVAVAKTRQTLYDEMSRYGYDYRHTMVWPDSI